MSTLFSGNAVASSSSTAQTTDLWSDILRSADRSNRGRGTSGRKNLLVLCLSPFFPHLLLLTRVCVAERHHGRRYLLDQLLTIPLAAKRRKTRTTTGVLAMGYEYLEVRDDGDEGLVFPLLLEMKLRTENRFNTACIGFLSPFFGSDLTRPRPSLLTSEISCCASCTAADR